MSCACTLKDVVLGNTGCPQNGIMQGSRHVTSSCTSNKPSQLAVRRFASSGRTGGFNSKEPKQKFFSTVSTASKVTVGGGQVNSSSAHAMVARKNEAWSLMEAVVEAF